jgi:hypothetical protein
VLIALRVRENGNKELLADEAGYRKSTGCLIDQLANGCLKSTSGPR